MSTSGEAADQMAREALQFSEVAIKLTALGFKNSLALALAYAKENPKVRGKTSLDRLLRENKELKVIPIKTEDVSQFKEYARQYGVLFAVIKDKSAQGEKVDIMFKAEDVSKPNRSYEQMGYHLPKNSEMRANCYVSWCYDSDRRDTRFLMALSRISSAAVRSLGVRPSIRLAISPFR